VKGVKMNEQFTKTLDALEAAENEMIELHNILDGLEIRNRASWHETQAVAGFRDKLKTMQASIRAMLGKREDEMLRGLRAEHGVHPTLGKARRIEEDTPGQFDPAYEDLFKPAQSG